MALDGGIRPCYFDGEIKVIACGAIGSESSPFDWKTEPNHCFRGGEIITFGLKKDEDIHTHATNLINTTYAHIATHIRR